MASPIPELNPVVVAIAESFGLPTLTMVKVASVVLVAAVVVILVPRRRRMGTAVLSVGVAAVPAGRHLERSHTLRAGRPLGARLDGGIGRS